MIKILDFLYYFIYQLNRRGYKTDNYQNARFGLGFLFFIIFISITFLPDPLLEKYLGLKVPSSFWGILAAAIAFGLSFFLTNKYYAPNRPRSWVVSEFDKKYKIRKQNSIVQIMLLSLLIVSFFTFCYILGIRLRHHLGLWVP